MRWKRLSIDFQFQKDKSRNGASQRRDPHSSLLCYSSAFYGAYPSGFRVRRTMGNSTFLSSFLFPVANKYFFIVASLVPGRNSGDALTDLSTTSVPSTSSGSMGSVSHYIADLQRVCDKTPSGIIPPSTAFTSSFVTAPLFSVQNKLVPYFRCEAPPLKSRRGKKTKNFLSTVSIRLKITH